MKRLFLFAVAVVGMILGFDAEAKSNQKGETSHPIVQKKFTFE